MEYSQLVMAYILLVLILVLIVVVTVVVFVIMVVVVVLEVVVNMEVMAVMYVVVGHRSGWLSWVVGRYGGWSSSRLVIEVVCR